MVDDSDWRLRSQEKWLKGVTLSRRLWQQTQSLGSACWVSVRLSSV